MNESTFARKENGSVKIPIKVSEDYTLKVSSWFSARGITIAKISEDGTPTLCSQSTMVNTNTHNSDDTFDNVSDQVTDDSSD